MRKFAVNSDEAIIKMPDGRPLYAWENENEMAKQTYKEAQELMKRASDLMKLLKIAEIESEREIATGDIIIRFRMVDALANDFEEHPEKYYKRDNSPRPK